jgi:hypothetical protein
MRQVKCTFPTVDREESNLIDLRLIECCDQSYLEQTWGKSFMVEFLKYDREWQQFLPYHGVRKHFSRIDLPKNWISQRGEHGDKAIDLETFRIAGASFQLALCLGAWALALASHFQDENFITDFEKWVFTGSVDFRNTVDCLTEKYAAIDRLDKKRTFGILNGNVEELKKLPADKCKHFATFDAAFEAVFHIDREAAAKRLCPPQGTHRSLFATLDGSNRCVDVGTFLGLRRFEFTAVVAGSDPDNTFAQLKHADQKLMEVCRRSEVKAKLEGVELPSRIWRKETEIPYSLQDGGSATITPVAHGLFIVLERPTISGLDRLRQLKDEDPQLAVVVHIPAIASPDESVSLRQLAGRDSCFLKLIQSPPPRPPDERSNYVGDLPHDWDVLRVLGCLGTNRSDPARLTPAQAPMLIACAWRCGVLEHIASAVVKRWLRSPDCELDKTWIESLHLLLPNYEWLEALLAGDYVRGQIALGLRKRSWSHA